MPVKVTSKFKKILCNCQFMKKTPKHAEPSSSKSKCSFVNYSCKTYHQYQYFLTRQPATQNAQSLIGLGYYQIKAACNSQRSYRKRIREKHTWKKVRSDKLKRTLHYTVKVVVEMWVSLDVKECHDLHECLRPLTLPFQFTKTSNPDREA